jgi:hypothetical protein
MVVKRNQASVYQDLVWYFRTPPLPCDRPYRMHRTFTNGHGRREARCLRCWDIWMPSGHGLTYSTCCSGPVNGEYSKTGAVTQATGDALTRMPVMRICCSTRCVVARALDNRA